MKQLDEFISLEALGLICATAMFMVGFLSDCSKMQYQNNYLRGDNEQLREEILKLRKD